MQGLQILKTSLARVRTVPSFGGVGHGLCRFAIHDSTTVLLANNVQFTLASKRATEVERRDSSRIRLLGVFHDVLHSEPHEVLVVIILCYLSTFTQRDLQYTPSRTDNAISTVDRVAHS